ARGPLADIAASDRDRKLAELDGRGLRRGRGLAGQHLTDRAVAGRLLEREDAVLRARGRATRRVLRTDRRALAFAGHQSRASQRGELTLHCTDTRERARFYTPAKWCASCSSLRRGVIAQASSARSRRSSVHSSCTERPSTCASRSSTTFTSSV